MNSYLHWHKEQERQRRRNANKRRLVLALILAVLLLAALCLTVRGVEAPTSDDSGGVGIYPTESTETHQTPLNGQETIPAEVLTPAVYILPVEEPKIFVPYDVPLDEQLQKYTVEVAEYYGVPPELVFAIMTYEGAFDTNATADGGMSKGLMGIKEDACAAEMEMLGVTDLYNPYQNVTVGIVVLSDKLDSYDTVEEALMSYHAGAGKAEEIWFSKGIYSTEYSRKVAAEAERLREAH